MTPLRLSIRRAAPKMAPVLALAAAFLLAPMSHAQPSDVMEFKGARIVKPSAKSKASRYSRAKRNDQVTHVGGRSTGRYTAYSRASQGSRYRTAYRPTFTPVRITPVRSFAEDTFGVQLINGGAGRYYSRYGQYMRRPTGYRGTYDRSRTAGYRSSPLGSFRGIAP